MSKAETAGKLEALAVMDGHDEDFERFTELKYEDEVETDIKAEEAIYDHAGKSVNLYYALFHTFIGLINTPCL